MPLAPAGFYQNDVQEDKLRFVERFFRNQVYNFTMRFRYAIVAAGIGIFIAGCYFTANLQPPDTQDQWFPSNNIIQETSVALTDPRWSTVYENSFPSIYMVWGVNREYPPWCPQDPEARIA